VAPNPWLPRHHGFVTLSFSRTSENRRFCALDGFDGIPSVSQGLAQIDIGNVLAVFKRDGDQSMLEAHHMLRFC
jgi:hypothetical protein